MASGSVTALSIPNARCKSLFASFLLEVDLERKQRNYEGSVQAVRRNSFCLMDTAYTCQCVVGTNKVHAARSKPSKQSLGYLSANAPQQICEETQRMSRPRVCIVGGGISGLYSAMILEELGIEYDLFEASGRLGGRIHTHYFSEARPSHDYYEVGAMRFPNSPIMKR